jgi:hypothetical protein
MAGSAGRFVVGAHVARKYFRVHFDVNPPYAFGLESDEVDAVPKGVDPVFHADLEHRTTWLKREDGSLTQRTDAEALRTSFSLNDKTFSAADNRFIVSLYSSDAKRAIEEARLELQRVLRYLSTLMKGPAFAFAVQPLFVEEGAKILPAQDWFSGRRFFVFDNAATASELKHIGDLLSGIPHDRRLDQALEYFVLGDELASLASDWESDERDRAIAPLRFLQYWKALTTIIGDPSRSPNFQSRPKQLGLKRHFFRQHIKPLQDLRNDFGVAHIADISAVRIVGSHQAAECRSAAAEVIGAYVQNLKAS